MSPITAAVQASRPWPSSAVRAARLPNPVSRRSVASMAPRALSPSPRRAAMTALAAYTTTIGTTSQRSYRSAMSRAAVLRSVAAASSPAVRSIRARCARAAARKPGRSSTTGNAASKSTRAWAASPIIDIAAPFITVAAPHHGFTRWSPASRTTCACRTTSRTPPTPTSEPTSAAATLTDGVPSASGAPRSARWAIISDRWIRSASPVETPSQARAMAASGKSAKVCSSSRAMRRASTPARPSKPSRTASRPTSPAARAR